MEEKKKEPKSSVLRSKNGKIKISLNDKKVVIKADKINLNHP